MVLLLKSRHICQTIFPVLCTRRHSHSANQVASPYGLNNTQFTQRNPDSAKNGTTYSGWGISISLLSWPFCPYLKKDYFKNVKIAFFNTKDICSS